MKRRPSTPRRHPAQALLAAALLCGCEGGGEGQVSGSLFLRGCPEQGSAAAPAPFALDPSYFAADTIRSATAGQSGSQLDERIPNRMELRLQRSSHRPELTDAFALYLTDVDALRGRLGQPFPISAAPLSGAEAPLPAEAPPTVRAALWLRGTCPYANVQPQLRGTVTLRELGFEPGEWVDADFSVTADDDRGARLGAAPADRDAAGQLAGSVRLQIRRGRSVSFP